MTVGGVVPIGGDWGVMLELTFLTNRYNGAAHLVSEPANFLLHTPQAVGFSLVPAINFSF